MARFVLPLRSIVIPPLIYAVGAGNMSGQASLFDLAPHHHH
jgi:hypothetical protein